MGEHTVRFNGGKGVELIEAVVDAGGEHFKRPVDNTEIFVIEQFPGNRNKTPTAFFIAYLNHHVPTLRSETCSLGNVEVSLPAWACPYKDTGTASIGATQGATRDMNSTFGFLADDDA